VFLFTKNLNAIPMAIHHSLIIRLLEIALEEFTMIFGVLKDITCTIKNSF